MRGLLWHHCGSLSPGDGLDTGRAHARCLLRRPPFAVPHHHGWLTAPLAGATAARETSAPPEASILDPLTPRPSLVCRAAIARLSPCRWWTPAVAGAGISSRG